MTPADSLDALVARTEGLQPWRRLVHLLAGVGMAWMVHALASEPSTLRWLFGGALAVTLAADTLRLRYEALNRFSFRVFRALLCPREARRPSLSWFLLGVFLVNWLPPRTVAVPAILVLSLADPAASVVGRLWGTHPLGKGSWEGSLTFLAVAAAVLVPFVGMAVAVPLAAVVAAAEVNSLGIDDNVMIPVVTALGLWAVQGIG